MEVFIPVFARQGRFVAGAKSYQGRRIWCVVCLLSISLHPQSPYWTMHPFKGHSWSEADRKLAQESKREEQLQTKLTEHDYLECYCFALKNPPWGGYSIEEQILHEFKRRKKSIGQAKPEDTRRSRYSYCYANNALTGEIVVHEPFIDELFSTTNAKSVCNPI